MVKVIGITGSIAVGKSTVTHYLKTHGYQVEDADEISRNALNIGTDAYHQVVKLFGCLNDDQTINRKALGNIVFNDKKAKKQLEDIIHPYVISVMLQAIKETKEKIIFLDIPLLYEAKLEYLCDQIFVVYVNEDIQCQRLMKRNHISKEEALHLIKQQISIEEKKNKADYIVDNTKNLEDLYKEIEKVLKEIKDEIIYE